MPFKLCIRSETKLTSMTLKTRHNVLSIALQVLLGAAAICRQVGMLFASLVTTLFRCMTGRLILRRKHRPVVGNIEREDEGLIVSMDVRRLLIPLFDTHAG